jgi:ethylbenzene dioxygenase ferredoxin subunit
MWDKMLDKMPDNVANNIVRICAQSEIAPDSVKAFEVGDRRLAVFNIGGRFYITDDECTHASASLADGMLEGEVIECAMHLGAFHVPTGEVKAPPCAMALRTYKVIREGDDVLVDLDRDAAGELA